jgi:alkylhydroperoxidase family enzyme
VQTMNLTIHTLDTSPDASRPILEGIAADVGLIPNFAASLADTPTVLAAFDGLRRAVAATKLDPGHREVAGLAASVAVGNAYGVAFHSTVLDKLGVPGAEVDRIRARERPSDSCLAAISALGRAIVVERGRVPADVLQRARAAELTDAAILEIVVECTFSGLVGTVDNLADRVELDEFLAPRAWAP